MKATIRKIAARSSAAMMERLEERSLLSAAISDVESLAQAPAALEVPLINESPSTQTTTNLSISGELLEGASLTFTATVSNIDPSAPVPMGDVAFLALRFPTQRGLPTASYGKFIDPATGGYDAVVMKIVTLSDTGVATFSTNTFRVGTYAIVAVFLGQEPAVLPNIYGDHNVFGNGRLLTPGLYLEEHLWWSAGDGQLNHYLLTDGKAFNIKDGTISLLSSIPPDAITIPDEGFTSDGTERDFAAVDTPLLVVTSWNGSVMQYTISPTSITPNSAFAGNPDLHTSRSDIATFTVKAQTRLDAKALYSFTYTNPPTFTVGIATATQSTVRWNWEPPEARGDYLSATAGIAISGGGGGSSSGSGSVVNGGGGLSYEGPMPTGSIRFYEGDALIGTAPIADGAAAFLAASRSLTLGQHSVRAVYGGDDNFMPVEAVINFQITNTPTYTTISAPSRVGEGADFFLAARVTTGALDVVVPNGLVSFFVDDEKVAEVSLGKFRNLDLHLSLGTHIIRADYAGSTTILPSSGSFTIDVVRPELAPPVHRLPTAINFSHSLNSSKPPRKFHIRPSVTTAYPGFVPSGSLSLYIDGKKTSIAKVGHSFTLPLHLADGNHKFQLRYSGDDRALLARTENYRFRVRSGRVTAMQFITFRSPITLLNY